MDSFPVMGTWIGVVVTMDVILAVSSMTGKRFSSGPRSAEQVIECSGVSRTA